MKTLQMELTLLMAIISAAASAEDLVMPNESVKQAMAAVEAARSKAQSDPARPVYHFMPPAQWNNDPNGPIYFDGYYHLFYQHNPYADQWEHMHWGHARSKDLVHWEHLPIALWPSKERGEDHCFSGCAAIAPNGTPLLIYTSIGKRLPEQWAARPLDKEWRTWEKLPENPIMTEELHGKQKIYDWRDPYVFHRGKETFLVVGGNLNESKGGQATVQVYKAENAGLTKWKYEGVLFTHPDKDANNIECPNFLPLDNKWLLIVSPYRSVEYFSGSLEGDAPRFTSTGRGIVDYGDYYAPNGCFDPKGRHILWGWVRNFPQGKGWNGCMSLPRVLRLDAQGKLRQTPAPELEQLRGAPFDIQWQGEIPKGDKVLEGVRGDALEIKCTLDFEYGKRVGLRLRRSDDGKRAVEITVDEHTLNIAGIKLPRAHSQLQIFLDKSVLEVFVGDGAYCVTKVIDAPPGDLGVSAFAEDGLGVLGRLEAWPMRSIWQP